MRSQLIVLFLIVSGMAFAADQPTKGPPPEGVEKGGPPPEGSQRGPRRPPPEALDACKDKTSGVECSFNDRQGNSRSGTCWAPDPSKPLACRPADANKAPR